MDEHGEEIIGKNGVLYSINLDDQLRCLILCFSSTFILVSTQAPGFKKPQD